MNESSPMLEYAQPQQRGIHPVLEWTVRLTVLISVGFFAYAWCALSPRALVCFDRSSIEGWESYEQIDVPLPVHARDTLWTCLGPMGWVVAAGVFGMAGIMGVAVGRWAWPVRMLIAVAPPLLAVIGWMRDIRVELVPTFLLIAAGETVIAMAAAGLAGAIGRHGKGVLR